MADDQAQNIPSEILRFFRENVGEMLQVKGAPGSGKTLFSLELMKALCKTKKGIAIFTRMDQDQLTSEKPWLYGKEGSNIIPFHQNDKIADPNWFKRELQTLLEENQDPPIGYMLIDTIDAVTEPYDNPQRKVKEIASLVQGTNVSAILVQEDEGTSYIDFLAGGIVSISMHTLNGRWYRSLRIDKLRGVETIHTDYLVTLHNGTFRAFQPWTSVGMEQRPWVVQNNTEEHFSSGLEDLDDILGGGFLKGSYNILDVEDDITTSEYFLLLRPVLLNFLNHGYGVMMVPPAGEHPESIRNDLVNFIDRKKLDSKLFFLDYFSSSSDKPYILPMNSPRKDSVQQKGKEAIQYLRGKDNKPYLDFVGLDAMEYLKGESITLKHLLTGVSKAKVTKTLGIGLVKPGLKITQGIKNMADVYIKMFKINQITCMYGIKPHTGLFAIVPNPEHGFPNLSMIPLS